jgi:RHS repeat-associated protein
MRKLKLRRKSSTRATTKRQFLKPAAERLEPRIVLASDWQNPVLAADVNGDSAVTALDVLQIINYINSGRPKTLSEAQAASTDTTTPAYLDASGDGVVSALDCLQVINYINANAKPQNGAVDSAVALNLSPALSSVEAVDNGTPPAIVNNLAPLSVPQSNETLVNTRTKDVQETPAVATSAAGTVIVWASVSQDGSGWGVYGQRYDTNGKKVGGEFRINTTTKYDQRAPQVAMFADGRFVVAWESLNQDGSGWGVYSRLYKANGTAASGEIRINQSTNGTQQYPDVAVLSDGTFAVTWEGKGKVDKTHTETYEVFVRRFSATGSPLSAEQRVNSSVVGSQQDATIAALPAGGFVVGWDGYGSADPYGVYVRRYASNATPTGPEILVNPEFTIGVQQTPAIAVSRTGQMLVAWASTDQQSGFGVYGHLLTADGMLLNDQILISQSQIGTQWNPSATAIGDGSFVVGWEGFSSKDDYSIYTRRVSSSGASVGDEQIMSSRVKGVRRNTALAGAQTSYVIAWDGYGPGDSFGIFTEGKGGGFGPVPNQPPIITVPGSQTVQQNQTLVFVSAGHPLVSVDDPDAGSDSEQISLAATNGTLTLGGTSGLSFTVGDGTTDTSMTFTGSLASINTALGGLKFTPTTNFVGPAALSITANDQGHNGTGGAQSDTETVAITVQTINHAPTFTLSGNPPAVNEDSGAAAVNSFATNLSPGPGDPSQILTFTLTVVGTTGGLGFSTPPAIDSSGKLTYTPSANANGTATVRAVLTDNGSNTAPNSNTSAPQTFTITVNAVNDAPVRTAGSPAAVSANEDSADTTAVSLGLSALAYGPGGGSDETSQTLTYKLSGIPAFMTVFQADGTTPVTTSTSLTLTQLRGLKYKTVADANGSGNLTWVVQDNGGTANGGVDTLNQSLSVTVNAVNDAPSFTKGPDEATGMQAIQQTFPNWATNISPGPANEASQTVSFVVTTDNPGFFSVAPAISSTGTLTYTPTNDVTGSAHVTVRVKDDGGTANGGVDTSAAQTFTIGACEFDSNLTGWTTTESGGSGAGKGSVSVVSSMAKLTEGNSFTLAISKPFTVPASPTLLTFEYDDLNFDTSSTGLIKDAFEAAFVNDQGQPLVLPYASGHDAFFNLTEGQTAALASGVTVNGGQVTVDLSSVPAGSTGHLVLRLVNNDTDVTTNVEICAAWLHGATATPLANLLSLGPVNPGPVGNIANSSLPGSTTISSGGGGNEGGVPSLELSLPSNSAASSNASGQSNAALTQAIPQISLASLPASALAIDSRGTDFWVGFNSNLHEGGNAATKTLFITGDVATTGTVSIPGLATPFSAPFAVNPGQVTSIVLPDDSEVTTVSVIEQKGIHITSNDPVSVYGLNREINTTDAFLGLPTSALGTDYVNLTYKNDGNGFLAFIAGTQMLVVGTQDNTQVTIGSGPYDPGTNNGIVKLLNSQNVSIAQYGNASDSDPIVVQPGGNYSVQVSPPGQSYAGTYKYRLLDLTNDSTAIQLGATVTDTLPTGQETKIYRFQGTAGQKIILDGDSLANNRATMRLITPTGVTLYGGDANLDSSPIGLPEAGTYYVIISGFQNSSSNVGFRVLDLAAATPLTIGASVSGTLPLGNETALYQFQGQAGQQIYYDSLSTVQSGNVTITSAAGATIAIVGATNDQGPFTLPTTGTYYLSVAGGTNASSSYGFRLIDVSAAPLVSLNTVVTGQTASGAETAIYRFQGAPGELLEYDGLSGDFPLATRMYDSAGGQVLGGATLGDLGPAYISGSGIYTLVVRNEQTASNGANFSFRLLDLAAASAISVGTQLTFDIPAQQALAKTIQLQAGHEYFYDGLSPFLPNTGRIYDPAGQSVTSFTLTGDSNRFIATTTGTYYFVASNSTNSSFHFSFQLLDLAAATPLALDTDVTASFPTGLETAMYQFTGTAGQRLMYDGLGTDTSMGARLLGPGDTTAIFVNAAFDSAPATLTESGTYTLVIPAGSGVATSATFRLIDLANAPAVTFGTQTDVTASPSTRAPVYTFNGLPGQRVTFHNVAISAATNGTWTLIGPNNRSVAAANLVNDLSAELPLTGQYVLALQGSIDSLSFQSTRTTPAPVAATGFGTDQTLTIAAGQQATYTFTAPAGLVFYVDTLANTFDNINAYVKDPNGAVIFNGQDADDKGPILATVSGTYSVNLQGFNPSQTGDYKFRVLNLTDDATPITLGTTQDGSITTPFGTTAFKFTGTVGQRIYYDALKADSSNAGAQIVAPDSSTLQNQNVDTDTASTLGQAGTFYVLIHNNSAGAAVYKFRLFDEMAAPALALGATITGNIPTGRDVVAYTFTAVAGQQLFYDAIDKDFDPIGADLVGPGDHDIFNTNSDNDFGPFTVPTTGTYRLLIYGSQNAAGDFAFRLLDTSAATSFAIGDTVTGDIGPTGSNTVIYKFSGAAGQQVFYDGLGANNDNVRVTIYDPTGRLLYDNNADPDSSGLTLTQSGDYQLIIRGLSSANAPYAFRVQDLASATSLALDTIVSGTATTGSETAVYQFNATPGQLLFFNGLNADNAQVRVDIYDANFNAITARGISEDAFFTVTGPGPYRVFVRGQQTTAANYSFQIEDVASKPLLTLGTDVTGTLPTGQSDVIFRLAGTTGERVLYDGLGTNDDAVNATLYGPGGTFIDRNNADRDFGLDTLYNTGDHYVVIAGSLAAPAGYAFRVLDTATAPAVQFGQDVSGHLPTGRYTNLYRVTGTPPGTATFHNLSLSSGAGSVVWSLTDPENHNIQSVFAGSDLTPRILFSGEYVLQFVGDAGVAAPIDYSFHPSFSQDAPVTETGFSVTNDLTIGVHSPVTTPFSAPAGSLIYLDTLASKFQIPTQTITLNAGDTYQVRDELGVNDLTGATVKSDKPVAVFGSNQCTFVPDGYSACDHIVEELPPTQAWGRDFVTVPLATRTKGDTFRFLADTDGTVVKVNGIQVTTPPLNRGQYFETVLTAASQITSNFPILVGQYSNSTAFDGVTSDPFMVYVPPFEQFLSNYTVTTPASGFDINYINIAAPSAAVGDITVDGVVVPANQFIPIGNSDFSAAQIAVSVGSHQLAGSLPFGVFVYGFASFDSYGYVGGQSLAPVATASSLSLSPDGVTAPLNTSQTFSATVKDSDGQPVVGVRVDFQVSGVNPGQGFAFTDDQGVAQFSYVGVNPGPDVIQATLSNLVAEANIRWQSSLVAPTISVLSPTDGTSLAANQTIVATGIATADVPNALVSLVTVNGVPVDSFDIAGNFFTKLFVGPGHNTYVFTVEDSAGQTASTTLSIDGTNQPTGPVDFGSLSDVSGSFQPTYARTSLDSQNHTLFADIAINNSGQYAANAPLYVAIGNISDPAVRVLDADGTTPDGLPYYDFSNLVTGGSLAPHGQTGFLSAKFLDPNGTRFTYDLVFFGRLNDAPTITSLPKLEAHPGKPYTYDVNAVDPNGDTLQYSLAESPAGMTIDAASGLISWTPADTDLGTRDVLIRVIDGKGSAAEQHFVLNVTPAPPNRPPLFTTTPTTVATTGATYTYDANAVDPDNDTLSFSLTTKPTGMSIDPVSGVITWQPTTTQVGVQNVVIQVDDGQGGTAQQAFTVCVFLASDRQPPATVDLAITPKANNTDPHFTSTPSTAAQVGVQLQYVPAASDPDAGDTLTFDAPLGPPGSTVDSATGKLLWTPEPEDVGTVNVVLRVRDGYGGIALQSFTLQVAPANTPPVINTSPILTAVVGAAWQYQAGAQDADGDTLTFALDSPPNGMSVVPATGIVNWTPAAGQTGTQHVSLTVSDGHGGSATQAFDVVVAATGTNTLPTIDSTPRTSIPLGRQFIYAAHATDADANPLTFSLVNPPSGMTVNPTTGVVLWTPTTAQLGNNTATLHVADGQGGSFDQPFTVAVTTSDINEPPQIISTPTTLVTVHDRDYAYNVVGFDADNDPLTYSLVSGPAGMSLDPLRGTLRWTPEENQVGSQTVVVQVTDTFGATGQQQFTLNVECADLPPAIVSPAPTQATAGKRYLYAVRAIDPENDPIAFSLPTAPAGMTIDSHGVIRWQPTAQQLGPFDVVVRATDSDGAFGEQHFTVTVTQTVVNQPPYFTSRPTFRATLTEPYSYQAVAVDPEGSAVTYSLITTPAVAGMQIDPQSGLITWTPTAAQGGAYFIKVAADDASGNRGVQSFALLARANTPPAITSQPVITVMAGEAYHYDVHATDADNDPLTFALLSAPAGMSIDDLGRISWQTSTTSIGQQAIKIVAIDSHGASSTPQTFTLTVSPDTTAPTVVLTASSTRVAVGSDIVLTVSASDNVGVEGRTLKVGTQMLTLDANGTAVFHADSIGLLTASATATDAAGNMGTATLSLRVYDPTDVNGPQVTITSPTSGAAITAVTDIIGTVTDTNLASYDVQYARADLVDSNDPQADDSDYITIAHGTQNITAAKLGTFDPTLLQNDNYVIRVIAEDLSGNTTAKVVPISVTGDLKLGDLHLEFTDLSISVSGIPITVNRDYDSNKASESSDFGFAWSLGTQNADIRESVPVDPNEINGLFLAANPFKVGTRVFITNPDGKREGFTFDPQPQFSLFGGGYFLPKFDPDPGVTDALSVDPTPLLNSDGEFHLQFLGFPYNPSIYRLTTKEGLTYEYDQFNGLDKITDKNGATLTFSTDGIQSSTGQSVQFVRDSLGRIAKIIDPAGNPITYAYSAAGDLVSETDQAGQTTHYTYSTTSAHFLNSIVDSRGKTTFQAQFDADGRLISSTDGVGNALKSAYDPASNKEMLTDGSGNTTTITYDDRGNELSVVDPLGKTRSFTYDANNNVTTATDPLGNTVTRVFDSRGNITSMTDPLGNTSTTTYTDDNQVASTTDSLGHTATMIYDDHHRLIQFINALGVSSYYTYDDQGRPTSYTDNNGGITTYEYGAGSRATKITQPDGTTKLFQYDAFGNITRSVDENGKVTTFTYDATGRPLTQTDPLGGVTQSAYSGPYLDHITNPAGGVTSFVYDDSGRQIESIDAAGEITKNEYNADGQLLKLTDPLGNTTQYTYRTDGRVASVTNALGKTYSYGYDATGNRTSVTDADGNTTNYQYDALGRVTKVTDALGKATSYAYDAAGNLISQTDANGGTTKFDYDALGRLIRTTNPLGATNTLTYDPAGNVITATVSDGSATHYEYDDRGQLRKEIDPDGHFYTFTHDPTGKLISQVDELGHTTHYDYDALGRLITQTDPLGNTAKITYDAGGNVTSATDGLGRKTLFVVDAKNRLLSTTDPAGNKTSYTYDADGQRTKVTDALGQTTQFQYDALGELISRTDPLNHTATMTFDPAGNLTSTTDRDGRVHNYVYDADNRLIREDWIGAGGAVINSITTSYDAAGNVLTASDANSAYQYTYDLDGRLTSVDNAGTLNVPHVVLSYGYDVNNNPTSTTDNLGVQVQSTFNDVNLRTSTTWSGGGIAPARVDYQYDAHRQTTEIDRFSDLAGTTSAGKTVQQFDSAGRLTQITHENAVDAVLAQYGYTYDAASQLITQTDHGQTDQYSYDPAGQITSANYSTQADETFTYDASGNRTSGGVVVGADNRIASDGTFSYSYDNEGNLIQKTNIATHDYTKYTYDYRNRLTEVDNFTAANVMTSQVKYTYDVFDRRIAVTEGGTTTYTVYDRQNVWADYDSAGNATTRYLYGPGTDNLLARQRTGEGVVWYLTDRQGSVRDLANSAGTIVDHIDYTAFGEIAAETSAAEGDRFKFTGREYDSNTGLYDYRSRYYLPQLGVYLSEDTLGFCGGDDNLRSYVANNPTNSTDPSGKQAISEFGSEFVLQLEVVDTLFEFGGDDPYTFRVGTKNGATSIGFGGNPDLDGGFGDGSNGFGGGLSGEGISVHWNPCDAIFTGEGIVDYGAKKICGSLPDPTKPPDGGPEPFPGGEFQFLVESTAYKRSYYDHFLARFNEAIFSGVAEELNLIAKVAVTDDGSTLVEVRDKDEISDRWEAHGFAVISPKKSNPGSGDGGGGGPQGPPPPNGPPGGNGPQPGPGDPDDGDDGDGDGDGDGGGCGGCCCCCSGGFASVEILPSQLVMLDPVLQHSGVMEAANSCMITIDSYYSYVRTLPPPLDTNH